MFCGFESFDESLYVIAIGGSVYYEYFFFSFTNCAFSTGNIFCYKFIVSELSREIFRDILCLCIFGCVVFDYLCELKNLDDWTLFSRMVEQLDENTWIGTASGYQHNLHYHVRKIENPQFFGIE